MTDLDELYSAAQLAKAWNVSESTILRLARSGELKSTRVGFQRRFSREAAEAYLRRDEEPRTVADVVELRRVQ